MTEPDAGHDGEPPIDTSEVARRTLLSDPDRSDEELLTLVVDGLDRVLGQPPRRVVEPGETLLEEGGPVAELALVLEGQLELLRHVGEDEVVTHRASAGPILGLGALVGGERAFFTVRARTDVTLLAIPFEDFDWALQQDPSLRLPVLDLVLRSLARRHSRSVELQLENEQLSRELSQERDELARTLGALESAQVQLVEHKRLATLGELAAGLAHELNNPVTAITRGAAQLREDVTALLRFEPEEIEAPPTSTSERRSARRRLTAEVDDRQLAEQLVEVGVTDPEHARELLAEGREALQMRLLERRAAQEVRAIKEAADRVGELVNSLHAYARTEDQPQDGVDVSEGLDASLRLLRHRLEQVDVQRHYDEVDTISGWPGELNQVWTNLIANACDAMGGEGSLQLLVDQPDPAWVRVRVIDDGPGIDPEAQHRVFEPRFTTKGGRARYGLGLGLAISKQIVSRHQGTITLDSRPGRTEFTVSLPAERR